MLRCILCAMHYFDLEFVVISWEPYVENVVKMNGSLFEYWVPVVQCFAGSLLKAAVVWPQTVRKQEASLRVRLLDSPLREKVSRVYPLVLNKVLHCVFASKTQLMVIDSPAAKSIQTKTSRRGPSLQITLRFNESKCSPFLWLLCHCHVVSLVSAVGVKTGSFYLLSLFGLLLSVHLSRSGHVCTWVVGKHFLLSFCIVHLILVDKDKGSLVRDFFFCQEKEVCFSRDDQANQGV